MTVFWCSSLLSIVVTQLSPVHTGRHQTEVSWRQENEWWTTKVLSFVCDCLCGQCLTISQDLFKLISLINVHWTWCAIKIWCSRVSNLCSVTYRSVLCIQKELYSTVLYLESMKIIKRLALGTVFLLKCVYSTYVAVNAT